MPQLQPSHHHRFYSLLPTYLAHWLESYIVIIIIIILLFFVVVVIVNSFFYSLAPQQYQIVTIKYKTQFLCVQHSSQHVLCSTTKNWEERLASIIGWLTGYYVSTNVVTSKCNQLQGIIYIIIIVIIIMGKNILFFIGNVMVLVVHLLRILLRKLFALKFLAIVQIFYILCQVKPSSFSFFSWSVFLWNLTLLEIYILNCRLLT